MNCDYCAELSEQPVCRKCQPEKQAYERWAEVRVIRPGVLYLRTNKLAKLAVRNSRKTHEVGV